MLLSYSCIIKTSLQKDRILEILHEVTVPHSVFLIFVKTSDFIFYNGKFEGLRFQCMPLPSKVPPYFKRNSFLPVVKGEILKEEANQVVKIEIRATILYYIFCLPFNFTFLLGIFSDNSVWQWILLLVGMNGGILWYFNHVASKTAALFEKVLQGKIFQPSNKK